MPSDGIILHGDTGSTLEPQEPKGVQEDTPFPGPSLVVTSLEGDPIHLELNSFKKVETETIYMAEEGMLTCFENKLKTDAGLGNGTVNVLLTVETDGGVNSVKVEDDREGDESLSNCIQEIFNSVEIPGGLLTLHANAVEAPFHISIRITYCTYSEDPPAWPKYHFEASVFCDSHTAFPNMKPACSLIYNMLGKQQQ